MIIEDYPLDIIETKVIPLEITESTEKIWKMKRWTRSVRSGNFTMHHRKNSCRHFVKVKNSRKWNFGIACHKTSVTFRKKKKSVKWKRHVSLFDGWFKSQWGTMARNSSKKKHLKTVKNYFQVHQTLNFCGHFVTITSKGK